MSTPPVSPAEPIYSASTEESLLSSVDPTCEAIAISPQPTFPADYDPEWSIKRQAAIDAKKPKKTRRHKPPKDSRIYKAVMGVIALKAQGHKQKDIAAMMGLAETTVKQYVYTANKKGWININTFSDPDDQLDIVLKSKAVRNINLVLDEKLTQVDEDTGETCHIPSDRAVDMTKEVAKGTGLLKTHTVDKGSVVAPVAMALSVRVEIPQLPSNSTQTLPEVRQGSVGGVPSFDAEIIGEP